MKEFHFSNRTKKKYWQTVILSNISASFPDTSTISAEHIFEIPEFKKLNNFLDKNLVKECEFPSNELPQIEYTINKNESYFKVLCIVFADKSFEILITDITRPEKRRLLKTTVNVEYCA